MLRQFIEVVPLSASWVQWGDLLKLSTQAFVQGKQLVRFTWRVSHQLSQKEACMTHILLCRKIALAQVEKLLMSGVLLVHSAKGILQTLREIFPDDKNSHVTDSE